ncbi:class I SAM-dependent methyltransferase [Mesobacillus jeotgali]|uniref:class I SAM-dependent methyltransferase n=1 Tax=Mesobacillus jeotgali TaxID=129985 RepID=UPI0009A69C9F|nr:class I SAM-dependent methyltransferase [Mesobacillus jeotgali]
MKTSDWKQESEKLWDSMATSWNSRSKGMWEEGSRKDIVSFIKKFVSPGSAICDLGCGDGVGSRKLAEAGYVITGIDVSEEMLEKARQGAINCDFIKAHLADNGIQDNTFEAVMAINSIEWTDSPYDSLKEVARILKPDGFACIAILGPTAAPRKNSFRRLYGEEVFCNTIMPWELEKMAGENGWKKVGEYGVFKKAAEQLSLGSLPLELQQSLSFMWVFMFQVQK